LKFNGVLAVVVACACVCKIIKLHEVHELSHSKKKTDKNLRNDAENNTVIDIANSNAQLG